MSLRDVNVLTNYIFLAAFDRHVAFVITYRFIDIKVGEDEALMILISRFIDFRFIREFL